MTEGSQVPQADIFPVDADETFIHSVDFPEARISADCYSTIQHLHFVSQCCRRMQGMVSGESVNEDVLLPALWSAALVAYARCFNTGKRLGLEEADIEALPLQGSVVEYHRWLRDMRDKHIAHSVNPFEIVRIGVVLSSDNSTIREVESVAAISTKHVGPSAGDVLQLGLLAELLEERLISRFEAQQDIVLDKARALGVESIERRPRLQTVVPGSEAAGRARRADD